MPAKENKPLKLTYEQALEQLEALLDKIESGQAGLEDTLAEHERGVKLIQHCRSILQRVETRLTELQVTPGGGGSLAEAGDQPLPNIPPLEGQLDSPEDLDDLDP